MDSHHTRAHVVRAVYEGIVFCHLVHIDKLLQNREQTRAIRLGGGAAKSAVWAQMFADVTGLPVETIDTDELGTLGCAMAAAVAAGEFANLKEAAAEMVKIKSRMEPDMARLETYKQKFAAYCGAEAAVGKIWKE
jgi:L-xylulokinase